MEGLGKRDGVHLTNEQNAGPIYADIIAQLSREDILSWAEKIKDLDGAPVPALISNLRSPERVMFAT